MLPDEADEAEGESVEADSPAETEEIIQPKNQTNADQTFLMLACLGIALVGSGIGAFAFFRRKH